MQEKKCTKCGEMKPIDEFYFANADRDRRNARCKQCDLAATRAWQSKNHARVLAGRKRYREKHRDQIAVAKKKYNAEHKSELRQKWKLYYAQNCEQIRARVRERRKANSQALSDYNKKRRTGDPIVRHKDRCRTFTTLAVQYGILERQPCEMCGDAEAQKHHPDYNKPLEVHWLCLHHHSYIHRVLNAIKEADEHADAA